MQKEEDSMSYETFCDRLLEELRDLLSPNEDATVEFSSAEEVAKDPQMSPMPGDMILVCMDGGDQKAEKQCIYLKPLFERMQKEGFETVVQDTKVLFGGVAMEGGIGEILKDFERVKEDLILRPLFYPAHKEALEGKVHGVYGDIALGLYLQLPSPTDMILTVKVPGEFVRIWDIPKKELMRLAMENSAKKAPPRLYVTPEEMEEMSEKKGNFMAPSYRLPRSQAGPVLTCYPTAHGALGMFYPGVKERLGQLLKGSYYVVFTGVCDVHLHPVGSITVGECLRRLRLMNEKYPQDKLSEKIYCYDARRRKLGLAIGG